MPAQNVRETEEKGHNSNRRLTPSTANGTTSLLQEWGPSNPEPPGAEGSPG